MRYVEQGDPEIQRKDCLTGRYWRAFVVALLVSLLSGLANLGNTLSRWRTHMSPFGGYGAHMIWKIFRHMYTS